ncbi:MAG: YkgJ family cysteine cluster protein [Phycisphaerales bacterium]|nr:YkgJ family cysteine cluster protein [Phycisphaerales bacterium]
MNPSGDNPGPNSEWFDRPDPDTGETGLRFACTMCGHCCSGPPGFVLFTEAEGRAIADELGISYQRFYDEYTEDTPRGRSIKERPGPRGFDCVLLDRERVPGKAVCGVYKSRPAQCRSWPFWRGLLLSRDTWIRAKSTCPGLDTGRLHTPVEIRIIRDGHDA